MKEIRIGSGAGYAGDRVEPSLELIKHAALDYICYECLAERTVAIAQKAKLDNPQMGYNPMLDARMEKALPLAYKHKVKIITNMGAANPQSALKLVYDIAKRNGLNGLKIAAVLGDDVLHNIDKYMDIKVWETGEPLRELKGEIVSANAYTGIGGIVEALRLGADVVITGRVSDPALFLAPLVYEFGWDIGDYDLLGKGTMIGHLLECAGQITGGYYADPGKKDVPDLWNLGFPYAVVDEKGNASITKLESAGGLVNEHTCKEQLIYEIHDPQNYITPDCVADFSRVEIIEKEKNVVMISGASGKKATETFKVSIGYKDCYIGEGEMSYGGPNCLERGKLALEVIKKRLELLDLEIDDVRFDLIGINSLFQTNKVHNPDEVRIRVAARTKDKATASIIGNEVEALYTNGPAGGGGATRQVLEIISVASILISKEDITTKVIFEEVL